MTRRLLNSSILFSLLALFALFSSACDDSSTDERVDGDIAPAEDGDATDEEASDDEATDDESREDDCATGDCCEKEIQFAQCAPIDKRFQFPTPLWLAEDETTPTGYRLNPPADDKAAELLQDVRPLWYDALDEQDGFAHFGTWFIPLTEEAEITDETKIGFYLDGAATRTEAAFEAWVEPESRTLVIQLQKPIPIVSGATHAYTLAIEGGALTGGQPMPACDPKTGETHESYLSSGQAFAMRLCSDNFVFAAEIPINSHQAKIRIIAETELAQPSLTIDEFEVHESYDGLCEFGTSEATLALLQEQSYYGVFSLPAYQNEIGAFGLEADGEQVKTFGQTKPGFYLVLPKEGTKPYPLVLLQHGGTRSKYDLLAIAKPYLERGMAMIGIDLPYHGNRANENGHGTDMDIADFNEPIRSRDNFMQAASDHIAVLAGVSKINEALASTTGETQTLSETEVFYVGHSMGAISGTITTGAAINLKGASLIAGGAPYRQLLKEGLFKIMMLDVLSGRPEIETEILMTMIQNIMDGGDPINFPTRWESGEARDVFIWEIIDDMVANNTATDMQASAFEATLAEPYHHPYELLPSAPMPISANYPSENPQATRVVYHYEAEGVADSDLHMEMFLNPISHETSARCFAATVAGETCLFDIP